RYRQDRWRLRAEYRAFSRRSRLRADADRSRTAAADQDRGGMGAGRGIGGAAARLGLRLYPGSLDRARLARAAMEQAGRRRSACGRLNETGSRQENAAKQESKARF